MIAILKFRMGRGTLEFMSRGIFRDMPFDHKLSNTKRWLHVPNLKVLLNILEQSKHDKDL